MRVAFFTENFLPKVDGIVTVHCLLLDRLAERGIETIVVTPDFGVTRYNATRVIGVRGVTMPQYPELKVGPPTLSTYRQVKAFHPDVIHVMNPGLIGGAGIVMAKRLGVPILASFHLDLIRVVEYFRLGFIAPFVRWWTRTTFNAADYALAPSRATRQHMLNVGIRNVGLWRRGVDPDRFHPRFYSDAMRRRMSGGHPDDVILLYVGRLSKEKQLEQIRCVLEAVPGTRLALVGDGPAREALAQHFAGTPTAFLGYLQGDDLSQVYASADVFVFPSALESFGLVVVEAMAAGLPVVASRVGGVCDVVEDGVSGYTFAVDDVAAMVDGVRRVINDRDRMQQMGRAARAAAEKETWPAIMDEVIEHYAWLIASRSAQDKRS